MKRNIFQICIISLILSIVSSNSNTKTAKASSKNAVETTKTKSKDRDISEDFTAEIYFRLDKVDSEWNKRGSIDFISKNNSKNNKASVKITNENFDKSVFDKIRKECELKGTYYVRLSIGGGFLYSSIRACDLVSNNFRDKFIFNSFGSVSPVNIVSVNYENAYNAISTGQKNISNESFSSSVEFLENEINPGIVLNQEQEEAKKTQAPQPEQQSFFSKYWYVIVIVIYIMMRSGQEEPQEGAAEQAQ